MTRVLNVGRTLLSAANAANAAVASVRNEDAANNRTYYEAYFNNGGKFGGITEEFVYTANISLTSGTVANVANIIPEGSFIKGVTALVTSAISGPSGFHIGQAGNANVYANNVATIVGSVANMTTCNSLVTFPVLYKTTSNVMITSNTGTAFSAGVVRIAVHGYTFVPPRS